MTDTTATRWSREAFHGPLKRFPIHPGLIQKAKDWPTYRSTTTREYMTIDEDGFTAWVKETDVPCSRCVECDDEILLNDATGRLGHLTLNHGWRMNGKRYDGANQIVEEL